MADETATPGADPADPSTESNQPQPGNEQETASLKRENDLQKTLDAANASIAKLEKNNNEVLREKREAKDKAIEAARQNDKHEEVAKLQTERVVELETAMSELTGVKTENEQLNQKVAAQSEWSTQQVQIQLDAIPENKREALTKMPGWDTFTPENQLAHISHWQTQQPVSQKTPGGIGNHIGGQPNDEYLEMMKRGSARGISLGQFAAAKLNK